MKAPSKFAGSTRKSVESTSDTVKEHISVVVSCPFVDFCYSNPGKVLHLPCHPTNFVRSFLFGKRGSLSC